MNRSRSRAWIWAFVLMTFLLPVNFFLLFSLGFRIPLSFLVRPFLIEFGLTIVLFIACYFCQRYMIRAGDRRPLLLTICVFLLALLLLYIRTAGELGFLDAKAVKGMCVIGVLMILMTMAVLLRVRRPRPNDDRNSERN